LDALTEAFARHDDGPRDPAVLVADVHHAIEAQTFAPARHRSGVALVDAMAARFGAFAHVHVVGLVETDWPERARRSIFYTTGLLRSLGWPQDVDQVRAGQAAFRDLLGLASRTVRLHAFQLDGDAIVAGSPLVDVARDLPAESDWLDGPLPLLADDELAAGGAPASLGARAREWLMLRAARPSLDHPAFGGAVSPRPAIAYRVSRVDRYVDCPFKYFSESVLGLTEERAETAGLTPLERGTLVHELFERFYRDWTADGFGTITAALMPDAMERFARLAREALDRLSPADRALEETRLLGSIVARGIGERVFELEADAGGDIVRRLLERAFDGSFVFPRGHGFEQVAVAVRGKADRIDVFADGSLRVVDYKLGRLPDTDVSVQLGVYAHCAQQAVEAEDGRVHPVRSALYLAFGDDRRLSADLGGSPAETAFAVAARASDFAGAVQQIERGAFPPRPRRPADCQFCGYAGVCRKEYRLTDAEVAER
jgi:RecB family exonuclease